MCVPFLLGLLLPFVCLSVKLHWDVIFLRVQTAAGLLRVMTTSNFRNPGKSQSLKARQKHCPCPQGVLLEGGLNRDFLEVALSSYFLGILASSAFSEGNLLEPSCRKTPRCLRPTRPDPCSVDFGREAPKPRFEFYRGFLGGSFLLFFFQRESPQKSPQQKNSPARFTQKAVQENSPQISAEASS